MSHSAFVFFLVTLVLLIVLSAFFSGAETALMSINRYRLRHKARMKKRSAILILRLLKRPDRLLGMILIGNNFCNILASSIATLLAINFLGDKGIAVSTIILTFLILIFAEVAPKTLAALYPEKVSKLVVWPVFVLLKLFYPLVWLINAFANSLLRLLRVNVSNQIVEPLSREELRSIVFETTGKTTRQYQSMLLGILDLNKVTVDDVMIPRHEIAGIDVEQSWNLIQKQLIDHPHDWLPVYRNDINQVIGVLHLRELTQLTLTQTLEKEKMIQLLEEPYFIPEGTPLNIQLGNFQRQHKRSAFVVDEYG
ncbi:MAG TPA: CNNM domain-containing protein, partial [Gammaproteobacteria bacterium]|nr:CNNM domain-containing protein [Gammaproteobacteria bacterium]